MPPGVDRAVACCTKSRKVVQRVIAQRTSKHNMVYLQSNAAPAKLTPPTVSIEDWLAKFLIFNAQEPSADLRGLLETGIRILRDPF